MTWKQGVHYIGNRQVDRQTYCQDRHAPDVRRVISLLSSMAALPLLQTGRNAWVGRADLERDQEDISCCVASGSLASTALSIDVAATVPLLHAGGGATAESLLMFRWDSPNTHARCAHRERASRPHTTTSTFKTVEAPRVP